MLKEYRVGDPFPSEFNVSNLEIQGVKPPSLRNNRCNPNAESSCLLYSNHALIARPLRGNAENKRRAEALAWHQRNLPRYTQKTQPVILQGTLGNGEKVPVLGRFVPKLKNVAPATLSDAQGDPLIARGFSEINFAYFKALLKGKVFDSGEKGVNAFLRPSLDCFVSHNIMVGTDPGGQKVLFCDPDWFMTFSEKTYHQKPKEIIRQIGVFPLRGLVFLSRALFFKILSLHNSRHKTRSASPPTGLENNSPNIGS